MSIESPLDEPVHWVTEVNQGKHSLTKIFVGSWTFYENYLRASL